MRSDMIGKLVRWESKGQWLIARVTGPGQGIAGSLSGEVVDPGNYVGLSEFAPKQTLNVGDTGAEPAARPDHSDRRRGV